MKKTNWIQLTTLCFILSLTAACGGKNSSGGSSANSSVNAITSTDSSSLPSVYVGTPQGKEMVRIFNEALAWRNSKTENGSVSSTGFTRGAVIDNSGGCNGKEISLGFLGSICINSLENRVISFESTPTHYCTVKDSNNVLTYASIESNTIPYNYYGCNLANKVEYSKDKNVKMNELFTLNKGNWHLYASFNSGSYYEFQVGPKNSGPTMVYTLNTAKHSVYNPQVMAKIKTINSGWKQYTVIDGNPIRLMTLQ